MKYLACSIYDTKVEAYLPPFYTKTKGEAIRSFSDAANQEGQQFNKHAADYTLYIIGQFDDTSGELTATRPEKLATAEDLITKNPA